MSIELTADTRDKIKPLGELAAALSNLKAAGHRVVHCHGVFDLVHPGHIRYLTAARREGDVLVVTITPDRYVNKGPHRPAFTEQLRAENLASLQQVDYVAVNQSPSAAEAIRLLEPDVYVKGNGRSNGKDAVDDEMDEEEIAVRSVGARMHFTDDVSFSSSRLLNSFLPVYPPEVHAYLRDFRSRYTVGDIVKAIETFAELTVMVVGEAILDEYVYGDVIGKSAKEPILALRYVSQEIHVGGSVVIANHLAEFCERVQLVCYLGEENSREDFIRSCLKQNVDPVFVCKPSSPTIVKRRFVENYLVTKLLEIYEMNDDPLAGEAEKTLCDTLEARVPECDVVIAADYGHGLITPTAVDLLCQQAPFLTVNTQINAGNNGYHALSKYPRADYICVHEGEIRLDQRDRTGDLKQLARRVAERMHTQALMVTRGKHGTLLYSPEQGFAECPGLSVRVVDRVGAGDSVLAISSLCAAQELPLDVTGFIANMVGAQAVTIVGNRSAISRDQLFEGVESVLK